MKWNVCFANCQRKSQRSVLELLSKRWLHVSSHSLLLYFFRFSSFLALPCLPFPASLLPFSFLCVFCVDTPRLTRSIGWSCALSCPYRSNKTGFRDLNRANRNKRLGFSCTLCCLLKFYFVLFSSAQLSSILISFFLFISLSLSIYLFIYLHKKDGSDLDFTNHWHGPDAWCASNHATKGFHERPQRNADAWSVLFHSWLPWCWLSFHAAFALTRQLVQAIEIDISSLLARTACVVVGSRAWFIRSIWQSFSACKSIHGGCDLMIDCSCMFCRRMAIHLLIYQKSMAVGSGRPCVSQSWPYPWRAIFLSKWAEKRHDLILPKDTFLLPIHMASFHLAAWQVCCNPARKGLQVYFPKCQICDFSFPRSHSTFPFSVIFCSRSGPLMPLDFLLLEPCVAALLSCCFQEGLARLSIAVQRAMFCCFPCGLDSSNWPWSLALTLFLCTPL